jgi:hypothetical protein
MSSPGVERGWADRIFRRNWNSATSPKTWYKWPFLVDIGTTKPDPIVLSGARGLGTKSIEFIIACRSGLQSPAGLTQIGLDEFFWNASIAARSAA